MNPQHTNALHPLAWSREAERLRRMAHVAERVGEHDRARRYQRHARDMEQRGGRELDS